MIYTIEHHKYTDLTTNYSFILNDGVAKTIIKFKDKTT